MASTETTYALVRVSEQYGPATSYRVRRRVVSPNRKAPTMSTEIEPDGSEGSETFYARTIGELRGVLGY